MSSIRDEVASWLDENWDESITLGQWWRRLADSGYAYPTWPEGLGGRGWDAAAARQVSEALAEREVIGPPTGNGPNMGAATVLAHGTEDQKQRFVRALATGQEAWCQLFSEPGAGSDLAGLQTKARRDGDELVVTGQKVWNSSADVSGWGMLLCRTNPDVPKHAGISFVMIDMHQPGVEVRLLRQMNGEAEFCEVFLDGARARVDDVIGAVDDGWNVARTTLVHERNAAASGTSRKLLNAAAGPLGAGLDKTVGEIAAAARQRRGKRSRGGAYILSSRTMLGLARDAGVADHPVLRDELMRYHIRSEVYRLTNLRSRANRAAGRAPGPESSIGKLALGLMARASRDLGLQIVGAGGMIVGPDAAGGGAPQFAALSAQGVSLGGGTDEIQRNVIGERSLGLPREPSVDADVPFRDLRVGTQRS